MYMRKVIRGYENMYEVDTDGNVYSIKFNKVRKLKARKKRVGYYHVVLCKDGKTKTHSVHRLVAEAFIDNPHNLPQVDHYDGDRSNNSVENLRWVSNQQNQFNRTNVKGCSYHKAKGKYEACITVDGKKIFLGYYDTEEEAKAAYLKAKEIYHII